MFVFLRNLNKLKYKDGGTVPDKGISSSQTLLLGKALTILGQMSDPILLGCSCTPDSTEQPESREGNVTTNLIHHIND